MPDQPTIVVTGAAGFIGSHTADRLLRGGWRVVGIDNFSPFYARSWKEQNLRAIGGGAGIPLHEIDITDGDAVKRVFTQEKPAAVIHLAAMAGVRPSIEQPTLYTRVNVDGTTHLLQSAVEVGVKKFLFASSSSVYGNNAKVPFSETDDTVEPISPYAATKRAGELLCHTYWHLYRLPIFCLRFFTVFGPRQRPDLAIHKFTRLISAGKPVPFFGDGTTSRDYTFVDDIVDGIMAALDRCDRYRIYNLGGSDPHTLNELISELERALGKKAMLDRKPAQAGDVERTYADVARSRAELGYSPKVSLGEGLDRFAAWFRANEHLYPLPDRKG
jgi:UDP-glucuronate 4-epimerase